MRRALPLVIVLAPALAHAGVPAFCQVAAPGALDGYAEPYQVREAAGVAWCEGRLPRPLSGPIGAKLEHQRSARCASHGPSCAGAGASVPLALAEVICDRAGSSSPWVVSCRCSAAPRSAIACTTRCSPAASARTKRGGK